MSARLQRLAGGWAAPLLTGVLLSVSFPEADLFPLAFVALMPLFLFLLACRRVGRAATGHFLATGVFFLVLLYWIPGVMVNYGGLPLPVAWLVYLLLVAVMSLLLLPPSLFLWWTGKKRPGLGLALVPAVWTLAEVMRNFWPFGGFPWGSVGYSQTPYSWLVQCAEVAGIYGISFLVVAVNAAIATAFLLDRYRMAGLVLLLLVGGNFYGWWKIRGQSGPEIRVGIIQGNVKQYADSDYYFEKYFHQIPAQFDRLVAGGAELIIIPEAQNPYLLERDHAFRELWQRKVDRSGTALLLNSSRSSEGLFYNSVYLLEPNKEISYRYDKIRLVPFGEYVPLFGLLGLVQPLVDEVGSFSPGQEVVVGRVGRVAFAPLICYEAIFPELARNGVLSGADFLINVSNDGWYGETAAPEQHLQIARVRSVETRQPMVRATNSGYSALISNNGEVFERTQLFAEDERLLTVFAERFPSPPWVRFGYAGLAAIVIVLSGAFLWANGRPR